MQVKCLSVSLALILSVSMAGLGVTCLAPGETPTLSLEVYDGPDYSEPDNMCYYRVEAVVTGTPEPEIEYAGDDNVDPIGSGRVEVGVEPGGSYTLTATATNSDGTATASIVLGGDCSRKAAEGPGPEDTEADGDIDEDADADGDGDGEAVEPTISLAVSQDATYSSGDDVCYYRIQATVSGDPPPHITWSEDESNSSYGNTIAQVNLNRGETYTLTATATNSAGTATDSITLTWGCDEPEPEPEPETEVHEYSVAADRHISGAIRNDGAFDSGWEDMFIGDLDTDEYVKGYLSFDIRGLHGITVQDAEINFTRINSYGEPVAFASFMDVKVFNYVRLDPTDFRLGGVTLVRIPVSATSYTISGNTLKDELQAVLDNEVRDYFQLKLGLSSTTNSDGISDGIVFFLSDVVLNISYTDY